MWMMKKLVSLGRYRLIAQHQLQTLDSALQLEMKTCWDIGVELWFRDVETIQVLNCESCMLTNAGTEQSHVRACGTVLTCSALTRKYHADKFDGVPVRFFSFI